jgi:hypothetical protein
MTPMGNVEAELQGIASRWSEELGRAMQQRTAWAYLGSVELSTYGGSSTLGGAVERRVIPVERGKSLEETLERWRNTPDGRFVDRLVVQANTILLRRLPPARVAHPFGPDWLRHFAGDRPIVALGTALDLVQVSRTFRDSTSGRRLRICAADARSGELTAVSGEELKSKLIAVVSLVMRPEGVQLVAVVDNKASRITARLQRVDARLES